VQARHRFRQSRLIHNKHDDWNLVFAHHEEEDKINSLTLTEIADAQHKYQELKVCFRRNANMPQKDIGLHLIEDTRVLFKNGKSMIPTSLRLVGTTITSNTLGTCV
jgi:hypothetical protein